MGDLLASLSRLATADASLPYSRSLTCEGFGRGSRTSAPVEGPGGCVCGGTAGRAGLSGEALAQVVLYRGGAPGITGTRFGLPWHNTDGTRSVEGRRPLTRCWPPYGSPTRQMRRLGGDFASTEMRSKATLAVRAVPQGVGGYVLEAGIAGVQSPRIGESLEVCRQLVGGDIPSQ